MAGPFQEIHKVTDKIFVSGRQPKSAELQMQRLGIRSVLNLTIKPDPQWSFRTMNDGAPDDGIHKSTAWFGKGITFVLNAQHAGAVLLHCEAGVNRSPSMAYAVLRAQGLSQVEATHKILSTIPRARLRYAADAEEALQELGLVNHDGNNTGRESTPSSI